MRFATEVDRIRVEYERRAREIPMDSYAWSRPWNLLFHQQVVRGCIRMLQRAKLYPLTGRRIADIGCGDGTWLLDFMQWGANPDLLCGIDLSAERVEGARLRLPQADLRIGSASELPWPDESFDLVTQHTAFTSILDSELRRAAAAEMLRVLRPSGVILWFDFRCSNPRNDNVRKVGARELRSLFGSCEIELEPILLAPPIARLVTPHSWVLAECLNVFPFLRTHYLGLIRKRKTVAPQSEVIL
jgi:SAM-dependent methyltransferase